MTVRVRFGDDAIAEVATAARWYRERNPDTAVDFVAAVRAAGSSLVRWPHSGQLVDEPPENDRSPRRLRVDGFPYYLGYLIDGETVVVLAVAHDRRRPDYWVGRSG